MIKFNFLLGMLPPAIMAAACSKIPADYAQDRLDSGGEGIVSIDFDCKSSTSEELECLVFALDEDGKVNGVLQGLREWAIPAGNYRMWCVTGGGATARKKLLECESAEQILDVSFAMDQQETGRDLSLLTVGGNDEIFTLNSGEIKTILLSGKPLMAKICLKNIVNRTSWKTFPSYGPVSVRCMGAVLVNVPDSMKISSVGRYPLKNSTESKVLNLINECTQASGSAKLILPGDSQEEDLTLFCFPNKHNEDKLILAVEIEIAGEYTKWYNIPIGTVQSGYEYAISNLVIMKGGAQNPFVLTPTADFSINASTCEWNGMKEEGLSGERGSGKIQFSLSHKQVFLESAPDEWILEFEEVYGPSYVKVSPSDRIRVIGAGKYWKLYALTEGYASLSVFDGLSGVDVPVCVGESIKYSWKDCHGQIWEGTKILHTHQLCRLDVESWYGYLNMNLSGSMFSVEPSGLRKNFICSYPDRGRTVVIQDYFENKLAMFPFQVQDWDLEDCNLSHNGDNEVIHTGEQYSSTLNFPFDLDESEFQPQMVIVDPKNNCARYGITISQKIIGNRFTVSASTSYIGIVNSLGIIVYCRYGSQERKIMTINGCFNIIK